MLFVILSCSGLRANSHVASNVAEVRRKLAEADHRDTQRGTTTYEIPASIFIRNGLEIEEQQRVSSNGVLYQRLILRNHRRHLALIVQKKLAKSDAQKATIQEKRNALMRRIRRWQQAQLIYMPGTAISSPPTHDDDPDENDNGDSETPEKIPLVLPSKVEATRRTTVCLHQVVKYERQLRLAQLQDSLIELRRVRRIRHTLLQNHRTQIAGQGQRVTTRSHAAISGIEERISKFVRRYRVAYDALVQLDPAGEWQETYLELKDEDNRGPGKEDNERRLGDGSYTFSWIWLSNPRAHETGGSDANHDAGVASDDEVNEVMRVQWATSRARMERWAEEVELLQEEMRRVVMFLEWKSENWLTKRDARLTTASSSLQSGLQGYAQKQSAIHHNLAASFAKLWYPTLVSHCLNHSWITRYKKRGVPLPDANDPTSQTQGTFEARVPDEVDGGCTRVSITLPVQLQDSSDAPMGNSTLLLEEVQYVQNDDESGSSYLGAWDSPGHSGDNNNNNNNNNNDDDEDDDDDDGFDLDFY